MTSASTSEPTSLCPTIIYRTTRSCRRADDRPGKKIYIPAVEGSSATRLSRRTPPPASAAAVVNTLSDRPVQSTIHLFDLRLSPPSSTSVRPSPFYSPASIRLLLSCR
ncbi:50S ribosomal protein L4 [Striga asiatica]|uniref:50S ribosomal protein L4 n=1 Tax=Striga asiatica TaxID=4170 RepID=A0A5A7RGZ6_STRAF|nr:50S ribosomal protein L4 [Striga asiatica]